MDERTQTREESMVAQPFLRRNLRNGTELSAQIMSHARWPDGVLCPYCGNDEVSQLPSSTSYSCNRNRGCGRTFDCETGTVIAGSGAAYSDWVRTNELREQYGNELSTNRISQQLGVSRTVAARLRSGTHELFADAAHPKVSIQATYPLDFRAACIESFADLFCGIGGFHYAASNLGLKCVFASDIDVPAQNQYEHNFGLRPYGDITRIKANDIPEHDILFGGFPCQPFSIIGDRGGLEDSRGTLIYEIARILKVKKPKACVLENVKQLSTLHGGKVMQVVVSALEAAGFHCTWKVLNALNFGLPQKRERTIIVGFRSKSILKQYQWPKPRDGVATLTELLESTPDSRHFVSERIREKRQSVHTAKEFPSIWHENKGGNISSHPFSCALRAGASYNYLLVNGERRLTPREQLRLQGFPERFDIIGTDNQLRKQAGNAVPVPMIRAVIREVLHASSKGKKRIRKARTVPAQ